MNQLVRLGISYVLHHAFALSWQWPSLSKDDRLRLSRACRCENCIGFALFVDSEFFSGVPDGRNIETCL